MANCYAISEADCLRSVRCREWGHCRLVERSCVVSRHADCARSEGCREKGDCRKIWDDCGPHGDADCLASKACRDGGWCFMKHFQCTDASSIRRLAPFDARRRFLPEVPED